MRGDGRQFHQLASVEVTISLKEQLDEARERIQELEAALRVPAIVFYENLSLTFAQSIVLEVLLHASGPVTAHSLRLRINIAVNVVHEVDDFSVEMVVSRLRRRLAPHGITISRLRGKGFYLDRDNKARLLAIRISPAGTTS